MMKTTDRLGLALMQKLIFIALLLCSQIILADDNNVIFWQTYHRPPGIILTGEEQGTGAIQKTLNLVINNLPEYQHEMPMTTLARSLADMKQGKHVCHPALFRTPERESFMYFSQVSLMNPTHRLVVHKNKLAHIANNGTVDLQEAFAVPNMTFVLINGRSFSHGIDAIIAQHLDKRTLVDLTNTSLTILFQMIELGRVDASIVYPYEVSHYLNQNLKKSKHLNVYKIADTPEYGLGSIACPKTPWGKRVITKIDNVLSEIKPTQAYREAMRGLWDLDPSFDKLYDTVFLKN